MIYIFIGFLVLLADFITKILVSRNMELYETIKIIDGVFSLTYIRNKGMAWGMLQNQRWIFIAVTITIVCGIVIFAIKKGKIHPTADLGMSLIVSGAVGNLIDRIFYSDGVIDFIHAEFIDFPIFNIADIAVCVGAALIMIYVIFIEGKKERVK